MAKTARWRERTGTEMSLWKERRESRREARRRGANTKFVGMAGRQSDGRGLCASDGLCHLRFFTFLAFCPPARGFS